MQKEWKVRGEPEGQRGEGAWESKKQGQEGGSKGGHRGPHLF